jgi:hypothetical protein
LDGLNHPIFAGEAMGRVEPLEQKIERIVSDKRRGLQRTQREKEEEQMDMGRSQEYIWEND